MSLHCNRGWLELLCGHQGSAGLTEALQGPFAVALSRLPVSEFIGYDLNVSTQKAMRRPAGGKPGPAGTPGPHLGTD